ncbi:MAG: hypothetical protein ACT4P6_11230 [Gemmatimonadaceae bacterium]
MLTLLMRRHVPAIAVLCTALASGACRANSDWNSAAIDEGSRRCASVYRGADFRVFIAATRDGTRGGRPAMARRDPKQR